MGEGYPNMAGWGMAAIFKEAARLVRSYFRLFHPFIAAFLVPLAILVLLEVLAVAFMAPRDDAPPPISAFLRHHRHDNHDNHNHFGFHAFIASLKVQASENYEQPPSPLVLTLIYVAFTIAIWLLASLATAAIAKVVNSIYYSSTTSEEEENPSTHVKAIFKSLPAAFFRMFITSLWILLLDLTLNAAVTLPFILLSTTETIDPQLLLSLLQGCLLLAVLAVDFLFILSQQVAVLEAENYGLVAVKRSVKLVQAKVPTALTLFAIYSGFGVFFSWIVQMVALFGNTKAGDGVEVYVAAVGVAGGYLAFVTYWLVVTTVFYFVSKRDCGDGDERGVLDSENAYRPIAVSA